MLNIWFWLMLAFALADWLAVWRSCDDVRVVTKPLVLILLIGWFIGLSGWPRAGLFFGLALFFSLLGDIFLLNRLVSLHPLFFQAGLGAFLLAQLSYVVAFNQVGGALKPAVLVVLAAVAGISFFNGRGVLRAVSRKPDTSGLSVPVVVYMLALSLMLVSALSLLVRQDGGLLPALLIALGAALFYASDTILARAKFIAAFPGCESMLIIAYHVGQMLIAGGALFAGIS